MSLKSVLESILFIAGRPVSLTELAQATNQSKDEIKVALTELTLERQGSGVLVLEQNQSFLLSTNPDNAETVTAFLNTELREKLTDASIETLAIIAYKQPVSRAEIEAIRGVNSQYTLRLLLIRGLIEKETSAKDARVILYRTTHEFLQQLGLSSPADLPDFEDLTQKVKPPEDLQVVTNTSPDPS